MWCYHKMIRISWLKKISNERVLDMVGIERSLLVAIRKRQLKFVGHVVRNEGLEKLVLEGKINGKRQQGRQLLKYLEGLVLATGCGAILQWAEDHADFRHMVANVRP